MRSFARITMGVVLSVGLVTIGSVPTHAQVQVNQTCTIATQMTFTPALTPTYLFGTYARGYFANCTDLDVQTTQPVVSLPSEAHSGPADGTITGTCAVAALVGTPNAFGGRDWRNGVGVLIGGSVIVAGSAIPLTSDVAFAEVDVMAPDAGLPCLNETHATGVEGVNDTVL